MPLRQWIVDYMARYGIEAKVDNVLITSGSQQALDLITTQEIDGIWTSGIDYPVVEQFQAAGGSMVMLAKGNRSQQVREACDRHGGFYLGSIGGPAARLADHSIRKVEVQEFEELGMEAIWRIDVAP